VLRAAEKTLTCLLESELSAKFRGIDLTTEPLESFLNRFLTLEETETLPEEEEEEKEPLPAAELLNVAKLSDTQNHIQEVSLITICLSHTG
jgi:hypothetical protein